MKQFLLFCLVVLFAVSCKKTGYTNTNTPDALIIDTPGNAIRIDSVPLTIGNTWVYLVNRDTETIQVIADTIINGTKASVVLTTTIGIVSRAYYMNNAKGYYLAAYWNNADSLVIFNPAVQLTSFPNTIDSFWQSATLNESPATSLLYGPFTWQWIEYNKVTTPAGVFNCCKLHMTGDYPITTYQYYSAKGLVKEVQVLGYSMGPGEGPAYSIYSTTTLISVNF